MINVQLIYISLGYIFIRFGRNWRRSSSDLIPPPLPPRNTNSGNDSITNTTAENNINQNNNNNNNGQRPPVPPPRITVTTPLPPPQHLHPQPKVITSQLPPTYPPPRLPTQQIPSLSSSVQSLPSPSPSPPLPHTPQQQQYQPQQTNINSNNNSNYNNNFNDRVLPIPSTPPPPFHRDDLDSGNRFNPVYDPNGGQRTQKPSKYNKNDLSHEDDIDIVIDNELTTNNNNSSPEKQVPLQLVPKSKGKFGIKSRLAMLFVVIFLLGLLFVGVLLAYLIPPLFYIDGKIHSFSPMHLY